MQNQSCSFVGCHAGMNLNPKVSVNATFRVEDGQSAALLICNQAHLIKKILKISPEKWTDFQSEAIQKGELLYLTGKEVNGEFSEYCYFFPLQIYSQFTCLVRSFKNDTQKVFCIDIVWKKRVEREVRS